MVQMETQVSTMLSKSRSGESSQFQTILVNLKEFFSGYESTDILVSDADRNVNDLQDSLSKCSFDQNLHRELSKGYHIRINVRINFILIYCF